jgi:hypothetical protein
MKETFKSTFGIESQAGEILYDRLDGRDRSGFFNLISTYKHELNNTASIFICGLLRTYFLDTIDDFDSEFNTYKCNVVCTMYRKRLDCLDTNNIIDDS